MRRLLALRLVVVFVGSMTSGVDAVEGYADVVGYSPGDTIVLQRELARTYRIELVRFGASKIRSIDPRRSVAYGFARRWQSLPVYEALLEQDGLHLPQSRRSVELLGSVIVSDAMTRSVVTLASDETVSRALARVESLPYSSLPVVEPDGTLHGVLTQSRLRRLSADGAGEQLVATHARVREYLHTGQSLRDALTSMNRLGVRQMAVVDENERSRLVGIVSMNDIVALLLRAQDAYRDSIPYCVKETSTGG